MLPIKSVAVVCAVCLVAGAIGAYLAAAVIAAGKRKKKRRARAAAAITEKRQPERRSLADRLGVMNIILIICGGALLVFTLEMISLFKQCGAIPDTLVNCVFIALTGECGIMGWIKTTKEKNRERMWRKEDMGEAGKETQTPLDPPAAG